jgi:hypothetical protein
LEQPIIEPLFSKLDERGRTSASAENTARRNGSHLNVLEPRVLAGHVDVELGPAQLSLSALDLSLSSTPNSPSLDDSLNLLITHLGHSQVMPRGETNDIAFAPRRFLLEERADGITLCRGSGREHRGFDEGGKVVLLDRRRSARIREDGERTDG